MGNLASTILHGTVTFSDIEDLRSDLWDEIVMMKQYVNDVSVDLTQNQKADDDVFKQVNVMAERIAALERRFGQLIDKIEVMQQGIKVNSARSQINYTDISRSENDIKGRLSILELNYTNLSTQVAANGEKLKNNK